MTQQFSLIDNRQIRIFISSTFSDMQQERDYLMNKTFPRLRKLASERDVTLIGLDLRWGITEEDSKNGKVVEICLDEINNSRPFFIGLIGDRYGWCPTSEELMKNHRLMEKYGWLKDDLDNGLSITEIEMQYGVLRSDDDLNAFFYLKEENTQATSQLSSEIRERLERFRKKIRNNGRYPAEDYSSIEELSEKIEASFTKTLDKLFPQVVLSPLEKERIAQRAFQRNRCQLYIPDENNFTVLDSFLNSDNTQNYVVTGQSGMGKSSLIANWLQRHENDSEWTIIYHFVGQSGLEGDYERILDRLKDEVCDKCDIEQRDEKMLKAQQDETDATEKLRELMSSACRKGHKILIVLDAINQIADIDNAKLLNWLPMPPQGVKYLFSTLEEDPTMDSLKNREYDIFTLQPLDVPQRCELINNYLRIYSKALTSEQILRIAEDPQNENTFVLKTLLDELVNYGEFETLDEYIDFLLKPDSIEDFFQCILQRHEELHGEELVKNVLCLIASSRAGLSETELLEITGMSQLHWSQFFCAFGNNLIVKNGLITFSHGYVVEAVKSRYFDDNAENYNQQLQDFFIAKIDGNDNVLRCFLEIVYQCLITNSHEVLYDYVKEPMIFNVLENSDYQLLLNSWRFLLSRPEAEYKLSNCLEFNFADGDDKYKIDFYNKLGTIAGLLDQVNDSLIIQQKSIEVAKESVGEDSVDYAYALGFLGMSYRTLSMHREAIERIQEALEIKVKSQNMTELDELSVFLYNCLGLVLMETGNQVDAIKNFEKAQSLATDKSSIAMVLNNLSCSYSHFNRDKALEYAKQALRLSIEIYGVFSINVAMCYFNIAGILGDDKESYDCFIKASEIFKTLYGENSSKVSMVYREMSSVVGDKELGCYYINRALEINKKVFGKNHPQTIAVMMDCAMLMYLHHRYDECIDLCNIIISKSTNIQERSIQEDYIVHSYELMGESYQSLEDEYNAIVYSSKAIAFIEESENDDLYIKYYSEVVENRYRLLYKYGLWEEAIADINKSIFYNKLHHSTLTERLTPIDIGGNAYEEMDWIKTSLSFLACCYNKLKQYEKAIPILIECIDYETRHGFHDYFDNLTLAVCYSNLNDIDKAEECFEYSFKMNKEGRGNLYIEANMEYARHKMKNGEYNIAREYLDEGFRKYIEIYSEKGNYIIAHLLIVRVEYLVAINAPEEQLKEAIDEANNEVKYWFGDQSVFLIK